LVIAVFKTGTISIRQLNKKEGVFSTNSVK